MLGGEELATGFTGVGSIVGNKELVGVAEEIDIILFKITKIQLGHAIKHCCQTGVFIFNRVTQAVACGIEVSEQSFDVSL